MSPRKKTFEERRQELVGAISVLTNMLQHFEETKEISALRVVASQLRALVVYEPKRPNLKNPLLVELAMESNFPLLVYSIDPKLVDTFINMLVPHNLQFFSTGDVLSLEKTPPYLTDMMLIDAMDSLHIIIGKESLSMKQIIRLVADTEGIHYDPSRPENLDDLDTLRIMGLPPEYRTIYSLGKIVRDLGNSFIRATK